MFVNLIRIFDLGNRVYDVRSVVKDCLEVKIFVCFVKKLYRIVGIRKVNYIFEFLGF